jgi:two-component sensor histidine kinase
MTYSPSRRGAFASCSNRQTFLMRKLNHRSRNLFTVIQSLALHSIPDQHSREVFDGRLLALARAHGKLGEGSWGEIELDEIIQGRAGAVCSERPR